MTTDPTDTEGYLGGTAKFTCSAQSDTEASGLVFVTFTSILTIYLMYFKLFTTDYYILILDILIHIIWKIIKVIATHQLKLCPQVRMVQQQRTYND